MGVWEDARSNTGDISAILHFRLGVQANDVQFRLAPPDFTCPFESPGILLDDATVQSGGGIGPGSPSVEPVIPPESLAVRVVLGPLSCVAGFRLPRKDY